VPQESRGQIGFLLISHSWNHDGLDKNGPQAKVGSAEG
jgi:hypothetical protein